MAKTLRQSFVMNENVQDKAKALRTALGRQLGTKYHSMIFGCIDDAGKIKLGFFPLDNKQIEGIDFIEMGNRLITIGIELGYAKGEN